MSLGARTLQAAMPGLPDGKAQAYAPLISAAMREGQITTRRRAAAFLAQVGHESVSLRFFEEIASGQAYEGRLNLGNTQRGDGRRFKGRGPIQLTGRSNYRRYGRLLGLPLESNPTMAARPSVGFRIAVMFWTQGGLNRLADAEDAFDSITRVINGGQNGRDDRRQRWARIKRLGDSILPTEPDPFTPRERRLVDELAKIRRGHGKIWNHAELARANAIKAWLLDQRAALRRAAKRSGWNVANRRARYHLLIEAYRG